MRLRDDPAPINPTTRPSRKRKSPPDANAGAQNPPPPPPPPQQQQQQHQQQPPPQLQQQPSVMHVLPPPHVMMHPPHLQALHFAQYAPTDYTPGGMPPQGIPPQQPDQQQQQQQQHGSQSPPPSANGGRPLSNSKRAEQNRKAQRAFRERRDQHVKALESRSQLLDAALASADEANRRWEECRALVDQLRVENAALRAALSQAQILPPGINPSSLPMNPSGNPGLPSNGPTMAEDSSKTDASNANASQMKDGSESQPNADGTTEQG
ncbi:hypothetical protein PC9H_007546 [Pleurotus ostreatus]|nr:uncharacterized protein PC9H_007546 [Pleurotus ostreatus]KAF7428325.1 hypothetical protein PC9H_007546 [Pleurotus ostreatus]